MNVVNDIREVFSRLEETVYLYGAGNFCRMMISVLSDFNISSIKGILVKSTINNPENICDIKVIDRERISLKKNDTIIICIEDSVVRDSVAEELKALHDCEILVMGLPVLYEIKQFYYNKKSYSNIKCIQDFNIKRTPARELSFSVHLCEHCNLNCVGCDNFSPLAKESFTDIYVFEKDLKRLSELSGGEVYRLQLTGGEPLLNPNAIEYAIIARKYFPKGRISFLSNGLLIDRQSDDFWEKCRQNDIEFNVTAYPININYKSLIETLADKGVRCIYQSGEMKRWSKESFNLNACDENLSASTRNWANCYMANNCVQLRNGKMSCAKISTSHHFLDYFCKETSNMYISKLDFIDIYEINSIEDIFDFFAKPLPFCKYCKTSERHEIEWGVSKKIIEEWI